MLPALEARLDSFASMFKPDEGWDVCDHAITNVKSLLRGLPAEYLSHLSPERVLPQQEGVIALHWDKSPDEYVMVEISAMEVGVAMNVNGVWCQTPNRFMFIAQKVIVAVRQFLDLLYHPPLPTFKA